MLNIGPLEMVVTWALVLLTQYFASHISALEIKISSHLLERLLKCELYLLYNR